MREHEVHAHGRTKPAKRVGRGPGSGRGTYAAHGVKGQRSRRGVHIRPGFEGGQLPLIKRLPHQRGFTPPFRVVYQVVNVESLERFAAGDQVTPEALLKAGLVRTLGQPVKILGQGNLSKRLVVKAHRFSASAKQKIEAASGTAEQINATAAAQ